MTTKTVSKENRHMEKGMERILRNVTISIKQQQTKHLYTIIKSCHFIKKYLNYGHTIFKHFFFRYIYSCCIFDYSQLYWRGLKKNKNVL